MSNLEEQIRAEQQRLYEISSLTDEIHDAPARSLLEWASAQIPKLARNSNQLEKRAKQLRLLLQTINQFMGQLEHMDDEHMSHELENVYRAASDLNYPTQDSLRRAVAGQLIGQNAEDVMVILIAWLENDSLLTDALGED